MNLQLYVLTAFVLGVAAAVVSAMAATTASRWSYDVDATPEWIDTLVKWGTWRPKLKRPRLRKKDVSLEMLPLDDDDDVADEGTPGYEGRHRREVLEHDLGWRLRWSSYDTQGWPLAPTDAVMSGVLLDMRPDICCGRPAVAEPRELELVSWSSRPATATVTRPRQPLLALADI